MNSPDSSSTSTLGKVFINLSWILLLVALSVFFSSYLKNRTNPNQQPDSASREGVTEVVLKRNYQHHYVANGLINGTPVTFLVDTGATHVAIGPKLADKIGLERGYEGTAYTANGTTRTYDTRLAQLQLGDIQLNDVRASITMGMDGDSVLLGMSALKDIELTHKNGELTMRQIH